VFSFTETNAQFSVFFYGNDADSKIGIGYISMKNHGVKFVSI